MKKLLFILCVLSVFVACSDDNDNETASPIENLKMPSAETTFTTGQSVTIEGNGFTTTSQIWLRTATKATEDIQTNITEVTDNSITFEVPEGVEGKQSVILKQNNKEYRLGEITLKLSVEELYAYKRDYSDPNNYIKQIVKIDKNNGTEKIIANLICEGGYFNSPVYISSSKEIIGILDNYQLMKVNIENGNTSIVQLNGPMKDTDYQELFIDHNENLYAYKRDYRDYDNYMGIILKIDKNSGTEKTIATLTNDGNSNFNTPVYTSSSKEVIGISDNYQLIKVNIENGNSTIVTLKGLTKDTDYDCLVLDDKENLYAYKRDYSDPTNDIKQIVKIDKNDGSEKIVANLTFDDSYFDSLIYLSSSKEIVGISANNQLVKVNIENGNYSIISLDNSTKDIDYNGLIVVRK